MSKKEWCWIADPLQNSGWFSGETYSLLEGASPEEIQRLRKLAEQVLGETKASAEASATQDL